MRIYLRNLVVNPNPFGAADEDTISSFEASIGARLPAEYRKFLLLYNGGRFKSRRFKGKGGIDGRLHHVFGLHDGPKYLRLTENWKLSNYYEIGDLAPNVNDFLVFADTGTGDLLLISLQSGEVSLLDHETIEYKSNEWIAERIDPVALSMTFDAFVDGLAPDQ